VAVPSMERPSEFYSQKYSFGDGIIMKDMRVDLHLNNIMMCYLREGELEKFETFFLQEVELQRFIGRKPLIQCTSISKPHSLYLYSFYKTIKARGGGRKQIVTTAMKLFNIISYAFKMSGSLKILLHSNFYPNDYHRRNL